MRIEPEKLVNVSERVHGHLDEGDKAGVLEVISPLHPAEIAGVIKLLGDEQRPRLLRMLDIDLASDVLEELDEPLVDSVLESLTDEEVGQLLEAMPSDEGADVAGHLSEERREHVLEVVEKQTATELQQLLRFDEETAGGLMSLEVWIARPEARVDQVLQSLRRVAQEEENFYNVYVVNRERLLVGSLSLVQLVLAEPEKRIGEVMDSDPMFVTTDMDQEQVAGIFNRYNLTSLPVVNGEGRLVGRITVDDAMRVMEEEASEDITLMAGTDEAELGETSSLRISRARLPWLLLGLGGGIASAFLMSHFEASLERVLTLAFFVPVITALGGNVSIQAATIAVRNLATGEVDALHLGRRILKEFAVAFMNGLVLAATLFTLVALWRHDVRLGTVLALAIMFVCFLGTFMGAGIPLLLKKLSVDPALATGPFITASNDLLGLLVYLGLATLLLGWLR